MDLAKLAKAAQRRNITVTLKTQPGQIALTYPCGKTTTVQFRTRQHKKAALNWAYALIGD